MRGIRLDELVDRLRAEVGHSTNAQVGQNSYDYLVQVLSRTQRRLVEEYDWAHLKVRRDIAVQAGQRYYPCPEDLHYERIIDVDFKDGTLWRPLIRGIDPTLFNIHDSDRNHQNWPVQHWDVYENLDGPTDVVGFIELWPIPNRSASAFDGMVRLTGFMQAPELIGPNDKCVLDASLLVLYAAAEICARQNQADAQLKLTAAQQLMSRLQNQNSNKKKYVSFSPNADMQRKNPWRKRNIVGVSRSSDGTGNLPSGTEDDVTLRWNSSTNSWQENLAVRSSGIDSLQIWDDERFEGWNFRALRMENAYDPWLDENRNFNFMVVGPKMPITSNPMEKFGVTFEADRFTIRSGDEAGAPSLQNVAFRVDNEQIDIGLRSQTTNTFINGDCFIGMSENMYGVDMPFNSDEAPGTLFAGGIAMAGSYISGQSLIPIGGETGEDVLNRAFSKDAQLNMNGNRLYGLPAPIRPDDAVNLAYFEANAGSGSGPADNLMNGTEQGQLVGWDSTAGKYKPQSFVKFMPSPDRLEATRMRVLNAPVELTDVVNKGALETYIPLGTEDGYGLIWDETTQKYKSTGAFRYGKANDRVFVNKGLIVKENESDSVGYQFDVVQYTNTMDPWTNQIINLNSLQIMPHNDPAGSGFESGVAVLGDRFTVRVPATGDDPYDGEIALRIRELECVLGVDSYSTSTIIQGDTYVGYKRNNRPDNDDQLPGTLFTGGILVGRDKAVGEASIGMEGNIIWGLGDPTSDDHAVSRGWLENRSQVSVQIGDLYTEQTRQAVVIQNHETRIDDLEAFEQAQLGSNDNVFDSLVNHELRIDALESRTFSAMKAAETFDDFKQEMMKFLAEAMAAEKVEIKQ